MERPEEPTDENPEQLDALDDLDLAADDGESVKGGGIGQGDGG